MLTFEEEEQEVWDPSDQSCKAMSIIRSSLADAHCYIVRAPLGCRVGCCLCRESRAADSRAVQAALAICRGCATGKLVWQVGQDLLKVFVEVRR